MMTPDITAIPNHETHQSASTTEADVAQPLAWGDLLPAALATLFVPARIGRRVAQTSVWRVGIVYSLSLLVLAAIWAALTGGRDVWFGGQFDDFTYFERLRLPFAETGIWLLEQKSLLWFREDSEPLPSWLLPLFAPASLLLVWPLWLLFVPLFRGNEPWRQAYWRTVKLVLWSTTAVLYIPLAWVLVESIPPLARWFWQTRVPAPVVIILGAYAWLTVLLRLGAWRPTSTHDAALCRDCGYQLRGLPPDGRCPECGLAIVESRPAALPLPPWAHAHGLFGAAVAYGHTVAAVLVSRRFFRTVALGRGQAEALVFADLTLVLAAALMFVPLLVQLVPMEVLPDEPVLLMTMIGTVNVTLLIALVLRILWITAIGASSADGRAKPQRATVALSYATALFLPAALLLGAGRGLLPLSPPPMESPFDCGDASAVQIGLMLTPGVVALLWAVWRTLMAYITVRRRGY